MSLIRPSLLLSPDGSYDRNGAVSPTVGANVTIEDGVYGHAWGHGAASGRSVIAPCVWPTDQWTVILRGKVVTYYADGQWVWSDIGPSWTLSPAIKVNSPGTSVSTGHIGGNATAPFPSLGNPGFAAVALRAPVVTLITSGGVGRSARTSPYAYEPVIRLGYGRGLHTESVLIYPVALPDAEIARIAAMPMAWTMDNTAVRVTSRLRDQTVGLGLRVA